MSTEESTPETTDTSTTEEVVEPERPAGVSNEQWDAFTAKFDAFAERVEKGLSAKRPATPKPQAVTTPSKKPVVKTEDAPETKTEATPKKKTRGYWG